MDIAACSFGVRTRLVRGICQGLSDLVLQVGKADVEASLQEECIASAGLAQIHLGVDGDISRQRDLHFRGRQAHRTDKTGGPAGAEQLLGIRSVARTAGQGKRNVQQRRNCVTLLPGLRPCGFCLCTKLVLVRS